MRIAGIQISAGPDIGKNTARALEWAEVAAGKGARIICYPELFLTPWFPRSTDASADALAVEDPAVGLGRFRELSARTGTVQVVPFCESSGGRRYNSAAVFDNGALAGVYRKVQLPDLPNYRERAHFSPGEDGFPVFETSQGRIGVQICWDNLFPEGSRVLALKGAEIIFAPTAASLERHDHWERALAANAFANNLYVFRVNRAGQEDGITFTGRSFCAGPWGEMVSELAGSKEAIVLAEVRREEIAAARETWGFLKLRSPQHYGDLLK